MNVLALREVHHQPTKFAGQKLNIPSEIQIIFFDVDGVLVDSLSQHLAICRDKSREFGLDQRNVPDIVRFREMVDSGIRVSPMKNMFLACGFPELLAERAVADYERDFMAQYQPRAFAGVAPMLSTLRSIGLGLGLVTSNTRANVEPALGAGLQYIAEPARYYYDSFSTPRTKAQLLAMGADYFRVKASACLYVGDQPADGIAATEAGFRFLAVTYGWGFGRRPLPRNAATSVSTISERIKSAQFTS